MKSDVRVSCIQGNDLLETAVLADFRGKLSRKRKNEIWEKAASQDLRIPQIPRSLEN